jgi:hypothetical protein
MSFPVLIPARNEAAHIAKTLHVLPPEAEPIVIPNGCDEDDITPEIAEEFGATVLEGSPRGKMRAIQFGMQHLGERALEPFMVLDGDTRPLRPEKWLGAMTQTRTELDHDRPAVVTGSYRYEGLHPVTLVMLNAVVRLNNRVNHQKPGYAMSGANMLLHLKDQATVHSILELPNIWPLADQAIRAVALNHGGGLANNLGLDARVITDAKDRYEGLFSNLKISPRELFFGPLIPSDPDEAMLRSYAAEAIPDMISYDDFQSASA